MSLSPFLDMAFAIQRIKKIEMAMPIIKKMGLVTPLLVGDDLALKSTISSPQSYDREMTQLIYKHMEFIEEGENKKPKSYEEFVRNLSNIDKICLIFGIYKVTYDTFGKRKIKCADPNCDAEFEVEFLPDDLIHEDTFIPWEEEAPFNEYTFEIEIPYDTYTYKFGTKLPSIYDHNVVLSFITTEDIQDHIQKTGNLFALPEQMALLTRYIKIGQTGKPDTEVMTSNLQEILVTFNSAVPKKIQDKFFREYNKKFSKYNPKFYKHINCPKCQKAEKRTVNIELEFFRRAVFGEMEGIEEI